MNDTLMIFLASMGAGIISTAVGLGGGLLLLGVIPMFVPIAAVIPIQGVVNLTSNFSRFTLNFKDAMIQWLPAYIIGGLVGTLVGYPLIGHLPEKALGVIIAVFIIASVWTSILKRIGAWLNNNYIVAAIQGFLALFVGSVSTLSMPLLMSRDLSVRQAIVTSAMQMSVLNAFRVVAFFIAGFQFAAYSHVLLALMGGSVIGNYAGGFVQRLIPEKTGVLLLKWVTTALAVILLYQTFR